MDLEEQIQLQVHLLPTQQEEEVVELEFKMELLEVLTLVMVHQVHQLLLVRDLVQMVDQE